MNTQEQAVKSSVITMPQLFSWAAPAVAGAFLVMLLGRSGEGQKVEQNSAAIIQMAKDIEFVKNNYTPTKQTDDLRDDVRELSRQLNTKLETIIAQQNNMMMEISRRNSAQAAR